MDITLQTSDGKEYNLPISEQNTNLTRTIITKNEHPHPSILLIIILLVILVMYYIYTANIKTCLNGEWFNDKAIIKVTHNKWTDSLTFDSAGELATGKIAGNVVYLYPSDGDMNTIVGIYSDKKIDWNVSGDVWQRATYST